MRGQISGEMTRTTIGFAPLLAILIIAELVCSLESNMIYVALAEVYRETGDPVHTAWLITAFTLSAAGAAAICGRLGDIFGRQRLLSIMLAIALLGSVISALAPSLNYVILGRGLQGASMAILPLCYGILREQSPPDRLAFGVGLIGGTYALGTGTGAMLGGFIVDRFHWQSIFIVSAALALVALMLAALLLPASKRYPVEGKIDILGGVLFVPAIAMILLALSFLKNTPWHDIKVSGLFAAGVILLIGWSIHELRLKNPLISVQLLRNRTIALADLAIFIAGVGPMMVTLVNVPLFQQAPSWGVGFGLSAGFTGTLWFLFGIFTGGFTIGGGYLALRHGSRSIVLVGALASTLGWCAMMLGSSSLWVVMLASALLLNPGVSLIFAQVPALVIEAAPEERTSEATGLTQVVRSVGMAIGSLLVPFLLSRNMAPDPSGSGKFLPSGSGYFTAFVVLALCSLLVFLCILAVRRGVTAVAVAPATSAQEIA